MNNAVFAARVLTALGEGPMDRRAARKRVCQDCGEAHGIEARGRCRRCYDRWRTQAGPSEPGGVCAECGRTMRKLRRGVCNTCGLRVPGLEETGWSVADVADALGVYDTVVERWIARSWLRATFRPVLISDQALHNFLWEHPDAWEWARVDPGHVAWVRSLLHDNDLVACAPPRVRAARKAALGGTRINAAGVAA